jgi:TPR repeat protein
MARLFARTALLLVLATLTLGCSDVPAAQSPKPTDPWPAISAAIDRQDHATMLLLLRPLAAQGDARAQHNLGFLYLEGQGVAQDDQEAAHWFRLAAAQSDARAQYNLGLMYYRGQGVAQDDQEAARWFRLAAAQGNARAQSNLGLLYLEGKGVAQDYVRAHMWINIAASLGSGELATASAKIRDDFAEGMTPAQLEQAQTMARQCQSSDYKQCGEQAVK